MAVGVGIVAEREVEAVAQRHQLPCGVGGRAVHAGLSVPVGGRECEGRIDRAISTSIAVLAAGADRACVSMPTNSGPSMSRVRRSMQIACVIARMCASLKLFLNAEPWFPDVPKLTR